MDLKYLCTTEIRKFYIIKEIACGTDEEFSSFQVFVPNEVKLFGTAHKTFKKGTSQCGIYMYTQDIYISKSHVKAIDQPTRPCTKQHSTSLTTSNCLANFIESKLGCTPNILGSQFPNGEPCNTKSQLLDLANVTTLFQEADENEVFEMTGCLSTCEKDLYRITADPIKKEFASSSNSNPFLAVRTKCEYHIRFKIMDRSYEEEEQYIIYDTDSFFADIGGFMGLLLGTSLMSIYKDLEDLLKKAIRRSTRY